MFRKWTSLHTIVIFRQKYQSRLAQLVERQTFNLVAVGSSPTAGVYSY